MQCIEAAAPLPLQETYDNAGLLVGDAGANVEKGLIALDVTDEVLDDAIRQQAGIIIAHHPLIFGKLKRVTESDAIGQMIIKAIRHNIAIYAAHTNLDNVMDGVNGMIADKLYLKNRQILAPQTGGLQKLVVFCPVNYAETVRRALFGAGAGQIGQYDACSFNVPGKGTFRAGSETHPFVGQKGELHEEAEERIETIFPAHLQRSVLSAMLKAHPYEEVAYDIYPLENTWKQVGAGMLGELPQPLPEADFFLMLKEAFQVKCIRHSALRQRPIKKVAFCGGSGSFLINRAKGLGADVFVTGDVKYHDFFAGDDRFLIADIGHYESEQYTKELLFTILKEKFPNFALHISNVNTNSVNYF